MKLTLSGIQDKEGFKRAGIRLPLYDVNKVREETLKNPEWMHFGIGNIFRIFLGSIGERLLNSGDSTTGIICAESYDFQVVDKIYTPYDNLGLNVILNNDGSRDISVTGCLCEAIKTNPKFKKDWDRFKKIAESKSLKVISFTITEKGYALRDSKGEYFPFVKDDINRGPECVCGVMGVVAALLLYRFKANKSPLALVSMDNCSRNGENFRNSVIEMAKAWVEKGFAGEEFLEYVLDETKVSFPWTMIDKITPRPSEEIAKDLGDLGIEDMEIFVTDKNTYIAPFQSAEGPQYLVIEDNFPNGRLAFEKAGVYMTDRETVNKSERMKVTVCLNPIHSALATYGCLLGFTYFSDQMKDENSLALAKLVGKEGMEVVPDPKIFSPKEFLDECLYERFPNPYLGDTVQRLCTDISQGLSVRFGETIKSYVKEFGSAKELLGIPLAIAGWLRYCLALDDEGEKFSLSPDPLNDEMTEALKDIEVGNPDSPLGCLKSILSNERIFGINLYTAGIGEKTEDIFKKLIAGKGAVRATLSEYVKNL